MSNVSTTPAAPAKVASHFLLFGAATPPNPGGDFRSVTIAYYLRRILAVVFLCSLSLAAPQSPAFTRIAYTLSMSHPATHLFEVAITLEPPQGTASVDLQMPLWQPGRYSVANFALNVQEFTARADGQSLPFEKTDSQTWRVQTRGNRRITVAYKVFGDDLSGTYAQLDATHANFTGGETFQHIGILSLEFHVDKLSRPLL